MCLFLGFGGQAKKFAHVLFFCFFCVGESFLPFPLVKLIHEASVAFSLLYVSCTFLRHFFGPWWDGQTEMAPTNEGKIGPFHIVCVYIYTI